MFETRALIIAAVVIASTLVSPGCGGDKGNKPSDKQAGGTTSAATVRSGAPAQDKAGPVVLDQSALAALGPLPAEMTSPAHPITDAKIKLGRMLYYENRISKNHDLSCNSCHDLAGFGVDGQAFSKGHKGQLGGRNAPTVYNAAGHLAQFWDGREPDVEAQAKGPVLNPVEMAMPSAEAVMAVLASMPEYVAAFKAAFPGQANAMTYDNFGEAVGAFERRLVTPSRWDAFLEGDKDALTDAEKRGFQTFVKTGCLSCHSGAYLGGNMYQKLGAAEPWPNQKDQGRRDHTKVEADAMMFKVPSLRNVQKTAPYFHDASAKTLSEAVALMAKHQLGKALSGADVKAITTFLSALTGELPTDYIRKPVLPKSTDTTPKPDPS